MADRPDEGGYTAMNRIFAVTMAGLSLLLPGCSSTDSLIRDTSLLVRDPGRIVGRPRIEKNVVQIVALWEPSNGKGIDDKPARGFAGHILFFGTDTDTGCRVRGTVNIYEYDQYDADSLDDLTPLHTFSFHPDIWEGHRSEGTLGHSYSCFIPYMNKHRNQVNCGLKVELITDDGQKITSEVTEVLLPTRSAAGRAAAKSRGFVRESQIGGSVTQAAATESQALEPAQEKLQSLSIPLPKR